MTREEITARIAAIIAEKSAYCGPRRIARAIVEEFPELQGPPRPAATETGS